MEDARNLKTSCSQYGKNLDSKACDRFKTKLQYCKGAENIPDPYSISEGWERVLESWPDVYGSRVKFVVLTYPRASARVS